MAAVLPPFVAEGDRIVLYDGVCKLCGAWATFLIRFDRKRVFKLASLQSDEGQAILRALGLPTDHFDSLVVVEGGRPYMQSAALLRVLTGLPFPWPLLGVGWALPPFIRDWLYRQLAQNRYRLFGRRQTCLLPSPDHERRFLHASGNSNSDAG
jgi:predicted DCC family thiol-disulfide oxidoreductase YuxK